MDLKGEALEGYMKVALELETRLRALGNTYDEIEAHVESLGKRRSVEKPVLEKEKEISVALSLTISIVYIVVALIIGAIVDSILGWIFDGIFGFAFAVGLFCAIVFYITAVRHNSATRVKNKEREERYIKECREYKEKVRNDELRVQTEKSQIPIYVEQLDYIAEAYNDTMDVLEKLYDMDIVYKKYRFNIVAIARFCEYLESGRCSELVGHEGAYNIYEDEARSEYIISQLDEVIARLDEIAQTQWLMYDSLKRIERKQDELITSMHTVARNQDQIIRNQNEQIECCRAIEYNTEVLRWNSEIATVFQLYE